MATRCTNGMDERRVKLSFPGRGQGMGAGNLDPRAEEFRPINNNSTQIAPLIHHLPPPPFNHIYYPCPPFSSPYSYPYPPNPVVPSHAPATATATGGAVYLRYTPRLSPPQLSLPLVSSSAVTHWSQSQPTRALLLSPVPPVVTEETIKAELQVFGEVRAVEMERLLQDGNVTVHFYDLRHAQAALEEIQRQHMHQQTRFTLHYTAQTQTQTQKSIPLPLPPPTSSYGLISGQAVWAQFILPPPPTLSSYSSEKEHFINNQGTILVFNLDSRVSTCKVKELFQAFGSVKEVSEPPPFRREQRFIEFFDIRDAARAIKEMDGKEVNGNRIFIEFSTPGGGQRGGLGFSSSSNSRTRNNFFSRSSSNKFPSPPPPRYSSKLFRRSNSDASSSSSSGKTSNNFRRNAFSRRDDKYGGAPKALTSGSLSVLVNKDGESEMINYYNGLSSPSTKSTLKKNQNNNKLSKHRKQQEQQPRSNRPTATAAAGKNKQKRSFDAQFSIKEDAIFGLNGIATDTRTTVMIKNIPNKYSQKLLLNMLDNHCINCNEQIGDGDDQPLSSYDFVYLPIDFNNKCNVGYGFVNLTSPQATWRLYKAFHLQHWEVFNSRKICHITYARLQGLDALKGHFKNSKFACETDEYLPALFTTPRDGKHLTDPTPMGGHITTATTTTACSTKQKINLQSPLLFSPQITNGKAEECLHSHAHDEDGGDCGSCRGGGGAGLSKTSSRPSSINILSRSSIRDDSITGDDQTTNKCLSWS